jgi:hypothetical protein
MGELGFYRSTVLQSVDMFLKRYVKLPKFVDIVSRRCPKMYFYKNNITIIIIF